jgi:nucleotide-binding universal stress UspA family protein
MDRRLLLGIDLQGSPATQHALCEAFELLELSSPRLGLILLAVIPVPYTASPCTGSLRGSLRPLPPTIEQRTAAERALRKARIALQQWGIAPERIEALIRVGIPADELVRAAEELQVDCLLIGSRGNSLGQRVRRTLTGSTTRRVLRLASCPVMIVAHPRPQRQRNLVAWYEEAVTRSLQEHPGVLAVLTPREAARQFAPPMMKIVGGEEADAAARALERLASSGVLVRYTVNGELRYIND